MAEKEIVFKTRVKTGESKKDVDELNKSLGNIKKTSSDVSNSSASKLEALNRKLKAGTMNAQEMRASLEDYKTIALEAGETSPIGRKAIQDAGNLKDRLDKLDQTINQNANDGRKMQAALQLGGSLVAGYGIAQGSMAMLGVESEDLQKTFVKLQAATAVMNGLEQIRVALVKEGALMQTLMNTKTKVATALTLAYATATGTSTGALKAFRLALVSTGIGAIVVGLGLLIANFETVKKAVQDAVTRFKNMGEGVKTVISILVPFIGMIRLVVAGLEAMGIIEDDNDRAREAQQQRNLKRLREEQREIDKIIDKKRKENQEFKDDANFELRMMKAQGKSKEEIFKREQEIRKETIRQNIELGKQLEAKNALIVAERDLLYARGEIEEGNKLNDIVKENNNAIREINKANRDLRRDIKISNAEARTEDQKEEEKHQDRLRETRQKAREERRKKEEEDKRLRLEREKLFEDLTIENIEDANDRKLMALEVQQRREREQLKEKYGKDKALMEELELKQATELAELKKEISDAKEAKEKEDELAIAEQARNRRKAELELQMIQMREDFEAQQELKAELAELEMQKELENEELTEAEKLLIKEKYAQKLRDLDKETKQKEVEAEKELLEAREQLQKDAFNAVGNLTSAFFDFQSMRRNQSEEEQEKMAKRQFQINKAMQIGQTIIETYKGAQSIFASTAANPITIANPSAPFIAAGAAVASGLANVASIASQQFQGSAGGARPNVSAPNLSSSATSEENEGESRTITDTESLLNNDSQGSGMNTKVSIVDSEIKAGLKDTEKVDVVSNIG